MTYRAKHPMLQRVYKVMIELAQDQTSELFYEGFQRTGAGHRAAFWDGYNGLKITPHVIPGTPSSACYAAGKDFKAQQIKAGSALIQKQPKRV